MAEQQQDEVGPASALAWSKGSRASGGWRGHGRRARDATGRRRDLGGAWRGSWSGSTTSRRPWRSEREALDAGTHAPSGARGRQEARQGIGAREAVAGVKAEASSPATEQQRPEVNRGRWGDELATAMAGHKAWAWPDTGERQRRRRCELQRRARRQGGLAGRRGAMAKRRSRGTKEREVARALLSFSDGASNEEGIERSMRLRDR